MKIREGAYYRAREGYVVGPMAVVSKCDDIFTAIGHTWNEDGSFVRGSPYKLDLISEVYVSDTPPPSRLERYPAPPGLTATTITNGLPHAMPETKTLRDDGGAEEMTITTEEAELLARISDINGPTRRGAIIRSLAAERDALKAENARMKEVLERLARLGNGPHYGNSDGNMIARAELERLSRVGEKK